MGRGNGRPLGLKPAFFWGALRGAEAPLFHGAAWVRDSCSKAACGATDVVAFPVVALPKSSEGWGCGIPRLAKDARHGAPPVVVAFARLLVVFRKTSTGAEARFLLRGLTRRLSAALPRCCVGSSSMIGFVTRVSAERSRQQFLSGRRCDRGRAALPGPRHCRIKILGFSPCGRLRVVHHSQFGSSFFCLVTDITSDCFSANYDPNYGFTAYIFRHDGCVATLADLSGRSSGRGFWLRCCSGIAIRGNICCTS